MGKYSTVQAKNKAVQIFNRFGNLIREACKNSGVEESFLAGFTGVEAGIDRQGNIVPDAKRFEKGVYEDLISLRDRGYCFVGGKKRTNYSGVKQSQIKDADDAAIRALSTSYSFSQIMGWHCINNLKCTIAQLRDQNLHFKYTVQLLKIVGGSYMTRKDLPAVLRIWNTGNANGKTYHADYVDNALMIKEEYEKLLKSRTLPEPVVADPATPDIANIVAVEDSEIDDSDQSLNVEPDQAVSTPEENEPINNSTIVNVPQVQPEKVEQKEVSGIRASLAGAVAFITSSGAGLLSWIGGARTELIYGFFGAAALIGIVFIWKRFDFANREKQREFELVKTREAQAHELQILTVQAAANKNQNTVRIVPQPIQNSEVAQ